MKKFPKIKRLGHTENNGLLESNNEHITVQEKLDGANFRFTLEQNLDEEYHTEDRELVFGSRNVEYKNERDTDDTFQHAIDYVRENVDIPRLEYLQANCGELTVFGEAMHSHTIDYDWVNTPSFIGYSIHSKTNGFIDALRSIKFIDFIGLPTTRIHPVDVVMDGFDCPESAFYDGPAEGVVVKNDETGQVAKVRSKEFKEMHGASHGKTPEEYEPADSVVLAHQFATEARILKMIHKYNDRGVDVNMSVMEDLWRDVFDDIIEEEYDTIFLGDHTINTKDFRSEVASNTATVLQQYLNRPSDSVLNETTA